MCREDGKYCEGSANVKTKIGNSMVAGDGIQRSNGRPPATPCLQCHINPPTATPTSTPTVTLSPTPTSTPTACSIIRSGCGGTPTNTPTLTLTPTSTWVAFGHGSVAQTAVNGIANYAVGEEDGSGIPSAGYLLDLGLQGISVYSGVPQGDMFPIGETIDNIVQGSHALNDVSSGKPLSPEQQTYIKFAIIVFVLVPFLPP
jgi:hypothetical protein